MENKKEPSIKEIEGHVVVLDGNGKICFCRTFNKRNIELAQKVYEQLKIKK